jgi:hypothetical protein
MYIGFSTDRKKLEFLIEEEIVFCKKPTGRKRRIIASFLVAGGLVFSSMKASAELPDSNNMAYERVNFNRGGFTFSPINMERMGRQLSQEYSEYQLNFNSPPLSKRFDTTKFSQVRFRELAKDPKARSTVFHKTTVDEVRSALQA